MKLHKGLILRQVRENENFPFASFITRVLITIGDYCFLFSSFVKIYRSPFAKCPFPMFKLPTANDSLKNSRCKTEKQVISKCEVLYHNKWSSKSLLLLLSVPYKV